MWKENREWGELFLNNLMENSINAALGVGRERNNFDKLSSADVESSETDLLKHLEEPK